MSQHELAKALYIACYYKKYLRPAGGFSCGPASGICARMPWIERQPALKTGSILEVLKLDF
jgi:hypothetical protein